MHTLERALNSMVELMREHPQQVDAQSGARRQYFALYYGRLMELVDGALRLAGQSRDWAPVNVLLRSALECSIDLKNLAEHPQYHLVVRAMMLENRSALFRFRSQPAYGELVAQYGEEKVRRMGQRAQSRFADALKAATQHFPILKNAARNLSVLNRFRIAGEERRYQTEYTFLCMVTHNDMALLAVSEELDRSVNLERLSDENAYNMCLRFLTDALKHCVAFFGPQDELVRACMECLEPARRQQERKRWERENPEGTRRASS